MVRKESLKCLAVVMDTNPDHLETQGVSFIQKDYNTRNNGYCLFVCLFVITETENYCNLLRS